MTGKGDTSSRKKREAILAQGCESRQTAVCEEGCEEDRDKLKTGSLKSVRKGEAIGGRPKKDKTKKRIDRRQFFPTSDGWEAAWGKES